MGAHLELARPSVCLLSVLGLIVGLKFTNIPLDLWIFPILAVIFICASGNVINDYFDQKIDLINKPKRPLPSGKIKPSECFWFYAALAAAGLLAAYFVSQNFFLFAAFNVAVAYLYSYRFKRTLYGNLIDTYLAISVFIAPVFIFGGFWSSFTSKVIYLVPISFFVNYGREILKSVEDIKGDKKAKARTLPMILGEKRAVLFGKFLVFLGALSLFLPYYFGVFGGSYFLLSSAIILATLFILGTGNVAKLQRFVKFMMFLVLVVFLAF